MVEGRGYWRDSDGSTISRETALRAWRKAAHTRLTALAREYHATIRQDELADHVQRATGIHTSISAGRWLGGVLAATAQWCRQRREPSLTALVVQANGTVGPGYDYVLQLQGLSPIDDVEAREQHAAQARLECHQWAGVPEPSEGWRAHRPRPTATRALVSSAGPRPTKITPRSSTATRSTGRTTTRTVPAERPLPICPRCFLALPATGVCGSCD